MTPFYLRFFAALLGSILFLFSRPAHAQLIADTLELPEIEVKATRIDQPLRLQPTHIEVIDSARMQLLASQNIGEILSSSSSLFIRSQGPGGLATPSQRGLSPEQVQVLWEGIPINHLMLGQTDLSLLQASMFSGVQVSSGNPSTAFGGGSMSGSIYLSSDFGHRDKVSFRQSIGSFGQWQSTLHGQYSADGWWTGISSSISRADNDFEFYNRAYRRYETREHNRQEQENVMAAAGYQKGRKQFETKLWIQNSNNQIPGSVLETDSQARQDDQSIRWLSSYQTQWQEAEITFKNYFDRTELNYLDPEIEVRSFSTFRRWLGSVAFNYRASPRTTWKGEISGGLSGVDTNNYTAFKTRRQVSALINPAFSLFDYHLHIYPALRVDSYSDFGSVVSPSLGLNYELLYDKLYLRGQLSRDFNPPSFNALYWPQGGNPQLDPERSAGAEAGLSATLSTPWLSRLEATVYYNRVRNGIRWYPDETGVYSPSNVEEIHSKGVELATGSRFMLPWGIGIIFRQSGTLMQSKIAAPRFPGDAAVGNQMRYVPRWRYKNSLQIKRKFFSALIQYRWVSRRYITDTEDISNSLDPYHKVDLTLQAQKNWAGIIFGANMQVRNLLNENYEIIQWYAMPLRNYQFTLTATYNF